MDREILKIYEMSKKRYGAPKKQKMLEKIGIKVNIKLVQRRMKKLGIRSIIVKKFKHHKSRKDLKEYKNTSAGISLPKQ